MQAARIVRVVPLQRSRSVVQKGSDHAQVVHNNPVDVQLDRLKVSNGVAGVHLLLVIREDRLELLIVQPLKASAA